MPNNRHTGEQRTRDTRRTRHIRRQTAKFVILTDGEKTEKNYFSGLHHSLQTETPVSMDILTGIKPEKFIERCNTIKNEDLFSDLNPARIWIVFDRDRVQKFDVIIAEAAAIGCSVAWSNPCIEEWFWAYFDALSSHADSVTTNGRFKELFMTKTGRRYAKNLSGIYEILRTNGDEEKAIRRAEEKLTSLENSGITTPSEMYSATTVYRLVRELRQLETDVINKTQCKTIKEDAT